MHCINLDLNYFDHPKTIRLTGLLGKGSEVLPIRLWCYCGKYHCESGKLSGYSAQEVEAAVFWWGKSGSMIEAMCKVGYLVKCDDGYEIKDWEEYQGHLKMFKDRSKKANNARWGRSPTRSPCDDVKESSNQLTNKLTNVDEEKPPRKLSKSQVAYEQFCDKYQLITGKEYIRKWGKDIKLLNGIMPAIKSAEQWDETLNRFFKDDFAEKSSYPFGLLISQINKYNPGEVNV